MQPKIKMQSSYLKEQKRYTKNDLFKRLHCSENTEITDLIRKLKVYGILKAVKASSEQKDLSELFDEDIEIEDGENTGNSFFYVFTFVGVIVVAHRVLYCYPKYIKSTDEPKNELRQIMAVLERYKNSKDQAVRIFDERSGTKPFNRLSMLLYFLRDYYENGIYSNTDRIIENNGSGEILWDKTVNETDALFYKRRPYYINLQTHKNVIDEFDYFKRLHECVLTEISEELENAGLLDLFKLMEVNLSDERLEDFGDTGYILYRLERELNTQFNTRKQIVLKMLQAYIVKNGRLNDINAISLFGTNSFNLVWEEVCSQIMDNKRDMELDGFELPQGFEEEYRKSGKKDKPAVKDLIEKPIWTKTGMKASGTLIPDIITITNDKNRQFIIFDAKYYTPVLKEGIEPKGQPGIESITKQYLYQMAYQDFIRVNGFTKVKNCFLLPTEGEDIIDDKEVYMQMLKQRELEDIKVLSIPATKAYACYLKQEKFNITSLESYWDSEDRKTIEDKRKKMKLEYKKFNE